MTRVDIEGSLSFRDPSTKEELHVESVTLKHKGKKIVVDDSGTVISYQREEDKSEAFIKPIKPIIVVDINFLPSEDKTSPENIEVKYNKLFEGYIVVYIDSSNKNTQSKFPNRNLPIYKL